MRGCYKMKKLSGIVTPVVTPLSAKDHIDTESLERLVDHCIDSGLQALYPCGTTGEMMYLSARERKQVAETVINKTAGRVPVYVHVGGWNLEQTVELASHACDAGADGIAIVTPAFFRISEDGLVNYFVSVAGKLPSDFPVYLYAIPQCAVNDISVNVAERAARVCPNIVGIKYSYPDMTRIQQMMTVREGRFSVLAGPDQLLTAVMAMGGDGVVSGSSQVIPKYYEDTLDAIRSGNYYEAAHRQQKTNLLNEELCRINNIAAYKAVLKKQGILSTAKTRKPLEEFSESQTEELFSNLEKLGYHV